MKLPVVALALVLLAASAAEAQPYRLRGDALATARAPAGLLILSGEGRPRAWVAAEAVVWTGLSSPDESLELTGDALVVVVHVREPQGRAELTAGRFVVATGALQPIHIDGGSARARLPLGFRAEAFGGMPVVPSFGPRAFDWVIGGRVGHAFEEIFTGGVSYLQRREHGSLSDEEVGLDLAVAAARWMDLAARASYDLASPGVSEARFSAASRLGPFRMEPFASHRSPARLLPATSIFSALGDIPSDQIGITGSWFAAPRLDWFASVAARWAGGVLGSDASLRGTLRLDDRGEGTLSVEVRRTTAGSPWTGVRVALRVPVAPRLHVGTELELVIPEEDSQGRGETWPWGLAAIGWRVSENWEAAAALEANASPENVAAVTGLVRLGTTWEIAP